MCLRFTVPAMKLSRFRKASQSEDQNLRAIAMSDLFQAKLHACEEMQIWKEYQMDIKILRDFAFSHELHKSADCYSLTCTAKVPFVDKWVINGTRMLSSRHFQAGVNLRAGILPCGYQAARGRPGKSGTCNCCGPGILGHIIQVCPRTWGQK